MNTFLFTRKNKRPLHSIKSIHAAGRLLMVLIGSVIMSDSQAQADKRLVLADQHFAAGDYFTAAGLYGQFLNPAEKSKSTSDFPLNSKRNAEGRTGKYETKTDILFKQAESYRLANYWKEAASLYKKCFTKDSSRYASALYWHAVSESSLGNYASANESINLFLDQYASGNPLQKAAEKEKQRLAFISKEISKPDTVLYHVNKINSASGQEKGIFAPIAFNNQLLITSTQTDSVAEGMNPYHNRLFTTDLKDGNMENMMPLNIEGLDINSSQGTASLSKNGQHLYFTQWKIENGKTISSIYFSSKNEAGWSKPILLPHINKPGFNSKQPFCSADGKYLFFASNMNGGKGEFDIWYAPILDNGTTGEPVNAGASLNTAGNEQSPFYHSASGNLVFSSDRMPGMGGYDLFISNGWGKEWKAPQNMGYPVNSSRDDVYFYSNGKENILDHAFFSSDRGSECCLATYQVSKTPKKQMLTGIVMDCRYNEPIADAEVIMKDNKGKVYQAKTGADGQYMFEITANSEYFISLARDLYLDTSANVSIERRNETEWHTDTLYNTSLCMEKKLVIKVENVVTVYFDFDRSDLRDQSIAKLDSIYNVLMEDTTTTIQISGYTDGLGSVEYNAILSDKRAKSCADYLIEKGIDSTRISFESFGACCPVEMELLNGRDNPDGRSMNRRALININRKE